jgi:hypothetical protein
LLVVLSPRLAVVATIALAWHTASAAPSGRVVVADSDAELQRAVATALAPWKLEVIVDPIAPADTAEAQTRADADAARFVVWRANGDLLVFDRERGSAEHRESSAGTLDPVTAAAAALTIKTLMRLPPPPREDGVVTPAVVDERPIIRVQAGLASRFAASGPAARFVGMASVRPWIDHGWSFGLAGDLGTDVTVERAGFKGAWRDWAVLAVASWVYEGRVWELEPFVAGGALRSSLDGVEVMPRIEKATLATLRAGIWGRLRYGRWSGGISVAGELTPGAPTYTKAVPGGALIFDVPSFAFAIGLFGAVDLNR